ncbi:hypothetical protein A2631_05325 [Candidatus Daviesbacteria bacterium RIFCSPHIGHO2_01_FULL_44_29]|uniref:Uncharacterized protein n=1 Tax=Candidatus Daviesbacteria bacterium RIFCSPHIGHO2_02_FULL_43_12 TaxID=1797776 RepID=A0A1F5KGX7_9BACT|nr:MAG: hypothetical protein A2631_05325 [Candidatus Daviesbacteria bacterium RIFCSPHIGHO2_01_FULL_44_29]OGE40138.1 MAG: hypothetical protein A3D25_05045 [Candidatus Daviesbacteria bacterium RIFCSPHIGHO2_02_FULL_43_12]OGE70180.1 MAG: hypothetical protein A3B55_00515 [Candidatus Daviesbacteria bacterium RIFCSPLOWO2_01_FULL_43_15]
MVRLSKAVVANTDITSVQAFFEEKDGVTFIAILSAEGEEAFAKIRQGLPDLADLFFGSQDNYSLRFNKLFTSLPQLLKGLEQVHVLFGSLVDDLLFLQGDGCHQAYLIRGEEVLPLTAISTKADFKLGQLISGHLKPADRVLFFSEDRNGLIVNLEEIRLFAKLGFEDLDEQIGEKLVSLKQPYPVAALLLEYYEAVTALAQETTVRPSTPQISLRLEKELVKRFFRQILVSVSQKKARFRPTTRKQWVTTILICLILLAMSAGGLAIFSNLRTKDAHLKALVLDASSKLEQARAQKDIDPAGAKLLFEQSKEEIESVLQQDPRNARALNFKQTLTASSNEILRITTISDWPVFLNLDLVKKDFKVKLLSLSGTIVCLLDADQKALTSLDTETKSNTILGGAEQIGQAEKASINGDFVFSFSEDKGIVRFDIRSQKGTVVIKPDPDWGKIKDIVAFAGNIYLLDSIKNQIWKYLPTVSGYSEKYTYLTDGVVPVFLGAQSMQIDGSVWVSMPGGEVLKFTSGNPDFFSFSKIDTSKGNIGRNTDIFVSDDTDNFYLLDKDNSRIVILKKNGEYISQLLGEKFKTAEDFVVLEKSKRILLLENNVLYQVSLP